MILELIDEAVTSGARQRKACEVMGLHVRTVQRWRTPGGEEDKRKGPRRRPANSLTEQERQEVLAVANSKEYRDSSPQQIVPTLAERREYVASESSFYRILRQEKQLAHRQRSKPALKRTKPRLVAHGPNEVWTWDITYLQSSIRGMFFYLYLMMDMWSRKIVGWTVEERESKGLAAAMLVRACQELGVAPEGIVLHSDNGGPMKGSTMLATMQRLGIVASFSRPHVSDDNPYSESLFRTLKYRPEYPRGAFASLEAARRWVEAFVAWYNMEHLHSAIGFVTPEDRHTGRDIAVLAARRRTYAAARKRNPERWARGTRNWERLEVVKLNPEREKSAA